MIEIGRVTAADIPTIEDIAATCGLAPWTSSDYVSELSRPDSVFLKATLGNTPCSGFVLGRIIPGVIQQTGLDTEIYNIGVRPVHQHEGIGSRLMDSFLKACRNRSVRTVWLEVRSGNSSAISFYSKHKFEVIAVRKSFYRDPVEDAIVMKSDLYDSHEI